MLSHKFLIKKPDNYNLTVTKQLNLFKSKKAAHFMADEEYLDVVDENDNLIRTATFAEVKEKGLRRRTVNVMIADSGLLCCSKQTR